MTSKIKVDNINKVSDDSNIINKCGTTITLGASGDSIALASGATQTGFGRSGSVNWQTTPKTTTFTAVDGEGYFVNSGSALTMNLPAGSAGAIVAVSDYARNFATYNLTISPDGSEKIGGQAQDAKLNIDGQAATFVYVDSTKGWVNVQNAEDTETGVPPYIQATGGCITTCGNFKIHTFLGPGTFNVTQLATAAPTPEHNTVSYMVVAGGGGAGGFPIGGGGGAGGFREGKNSPICSYTASPLATPAGGIVVTASPYPISVGGGGPGGVGPQQNGTQGSNSTFDSITAIGGGFGAGVNCACGGAGGSGGGGQAGNGSTTGGAGNTPPTSPPQGTAGGPSRSVPGCRGGGGGGGAICAGQTGQPPYTGGNGGDGATTQINPAKGSPATNFAGGGGGGGIGTAPERGGVGGSGGGGDAQDSAQPTADPGVANTGGGGGGGSVSGPPTTVGGNGGSGIVVIRYRYQ
jgi:hypothetical protein